MAANGFGADRRGTDLGARIGAGAEAAADGGVLGQQRRRAGQSLGYVNGLGAPAQLARLWTLGRRRTCGRGPASRRSLRKSSRPGQRRLVSRATASERPTVDRGRFLRPTAYVH